MYIPIILAAAVFNSLFGQYLKLIEIKTEKTAAVLTINYLFAALILIAFRGLPSFNAGSASELLPSLHAGIFYFFSLIILNKCFSQYNSAVMLTIFRLSISFPVIIAVALWEESFTPARAAALTAGIFSFFLLSSGNEKNTKKRNSGRTGIFFWGLILFLFQGNAYTAPALMRRSFPETDAFGITLIILLFSFSISALYLLFKNQLPGMREIKYGAGLGIINILTTTFIITALQAGEIAVFPFTGVFAVIVDVIFAYKVWKQPLPRYSIAGFPLAGAALILINF
ncbi:MAG: hypothetical protein ACLFQK_03075 [Fibrobacterota bacterium]